MLNELDLKLIQLGLEEDLGSQGSDVTTDLLFTDITLKKGRAEIISKHHTDIVVAGLICVEPVLMGIDAFRYCEERSDVAIQGFYKKINSFDHKELVFNNKEKSLDCHVAQSAPRNDGCKVYIPDGGTLRPGETLLTLEASPIAILKAERLILNFIRHLSAVATMTAQFVKAVEGSSAKILDTRKTTPGFRHLEKYAVHCGGGVNHRMGLYDAIMIKDTHVDLVGGMNVALGRLPLLKDSAFSAIVEVRSIEELHVVLDHGREKVSRVLLDNIRGDVLAECVRAAKGVFETEASGNITLANVGEVAESGVEFISVGMITHSAGQVDLSMKSLKNA